MLPSNGRKFKRSTRRRRRQGAITVLKPQAKAEAQANDKTADEELGDSTPAALAVLDAGGDGEDVEHPSLHENLETAAPNEDGDEGDVEKFEDAESKPGEKQKVMSCHRPHSS
jgi:hypothetical protein